MVALPELSEQQIAEAQTMLNYFENKVRAVELQEQLTARQQEAAVREALCNMVPTLQESVYAGMDNFISRKSIWSNIPGMEGYGDLGRPTDKEDTKDGDYAPFWRTSYDHQQLQGLSRFLATAHEAGPTLLDRLTDYAVHVGMNYTVDRRKPSDPPQALIDEVQRAVDDILDANDWVSEGEGKALQALHTQGELRLRVFEPERGEVAFDSLLPEHICEPDKRDTAEMESALYRQKKLRLFGADWKYGVATAPGRTSRPFGYFWDPDHSGANWEFYPVEEVVEVKLNVPDCVKRGLSDFYPVSHLMKQLAPLASNLAIQGAIQASIALIQKQDPKAGSGVKVAGTTGTVTDFAGQSRNIIVNEPGQIIAEKGVEHAVGPVGNNQAEALIAIADFGFRIVGNRWAFPEYMSTANAKNNNKSSGETAETPFVRATERKQKRLGKASKSAIWKGLEIMARRGRFRQWGHSSAESLRRVVMITVEPPEVQTKNQQEEATRFGLMIDKRVISRRTVAEKLQLDYDIETERIAEEDQRALEHQQATQDAIGGGVEAPAGGKEAPSNTPKNPGEKVDEQRLKEAAELIWEGYP